MKLVQPVLSGSPAMQNAGDDGRAEEHLRRARAASAASGGGNDLAMNDTLVIFDYPENIEKAEDVIRQLDVRPRQVLIEATILAARLTEDMEFGINWNLLGGLDVTTDDHRVRGGHWHAGSNRWVWSRPAAARD